MPSQNPFPALATSTGYQAIASSCSETDTLRLANGNFIKSVSLVSVSTIGFPLAFTLTYNSQMSTASPSPVGNKWRHNYMTSLIITGTPATLVTYVDPTGRHNDFIPSGPDWVLNTATSYFFSGTLVQNASNWQVQFLDGSSYTFDTSGNLLSMADPNGNLTTFQYAGGKLVSITEPTGRSIQLAYTGTFITTVTDPNLNQTTLIYDLTHSNLTEIMGPSGCTTQYGYTTPANSLITSRTDPNSNVYTYAYNGSEQLTSVVDAETPSHTITYGYDTVDEYIADNPVTTQTFNRTTLTDAFSNAWEWRFDLAGNLWRSIKPVDTTNSVYHWKRFYWDQNQKLLYHTTGYPLTNNYSGMGDMAGPRDNINNLFRQRVNHPDLAVPLQHISASGRVTQYSYNSARKVTSVTHGHAHHGVQGNWVGEYGSDGYILCSFESTSSDVQSLPGYVSSVSMGSATRSRQDDDSFYHHLMDPRTPVSPTSLKRGNGYWQSGSAFTMTVNLSSSQSFNLSFYTASTDNEYTSNTPLLYNEQMGRDVTFSVTDMAGTHTYQASNNAGGAWVTFPVQGDGTHAISITLSPSGLNSTDVRISAIMFDPLDSHTTTYSYDALTNNRTQVTDALGNSSATAYNQDGTVLSTTDANGNTTLFFYEDTHKNRTRVRDAYGHDTLTSYDANGNVLSRTDANGHVWHYTYDGKNRVLTSTNPLGFVTTNAYDSAGNLLSVTDANGNQTQYQYTPTNRRKQMTDAASQVTQTVYDAAGNVYTVEDPNTNVTTFYYDNSNRLIRTVRADATEVQQTYDAHDRVAATTSPNGNQSTLANINLTGAANLLLNPSAELVHPNNSGAALGWWNFGAGVLDTGGGHSGQNSLLLQTDTIFGDSYFHQDRITLPPGVRALGSFWARPDGSTDVTSVQGSIVARQHDGSTSEFLSPSLALPTGASAWQQVPNWRIDMPGDGQFSDFAADSFRMYGTAASNTPDVWFDDAALYSLSTSMTYDADGRLVQTQLPDGTSVQRMYDRLGRLKQVVDAKGAVTRMVYDSLGRVTQTIDALGNTTSVSYDAVGNRLTVTDPNANVTTYAYDRLNRVTAVTYPDGSTETWTYDAVGNRQTYTNNRGQLFTYQYDAANRRVQKLYGTDSSTVQYGYDAVGNLISRIERNGDICWYSYDVVNRLVDVERSPSTGFSSSTSWLQHHVYDANSNRTEFDNGTGATGGVYDTAVYGTDTYGAPPVQWSVPGGGYDSMNRLTAYQDESSNQTDLSYDVEGRIASMTFPNGSPQVASTASYDIVGHLLGMDTAMGSTDFLPLTNSYDANANRVAVTTGADTFDYAVDATNQLIQEDINRFVERDGTRFAKGALAGVDATSGALTLISFTDTFSGSLMNADRWRMAYTENILNFNIAAGIEARQNNGLCMVFPRGYCNVLDSYGSGSTVTPPTTGYGLSSSLVFVAVEHRVPITGDCDLQVDFSDWSGHPRTSSNANIVLMIANTSVENVWDVGGNSFVQMSMNTGSPNPEYGAVISNNGTITSNLAVSADTSGKFRITRSGATVTAYYYSGGSWVSLSTVTTYVTTGTFYVSLSLVLRTMGHVRFDNFQSNLDVYSTSGTYTSAVYDAGESVTWDTIDWVATVPGGAGLEFQIATSSSPTGPFTFVGPDGTAGTVFTSSGTAIHAGTTGRYAQYQATLTGNGAVTPTLSRVDILFGGANTSTELAYTYDSAGNMTKKVTETPTGSGTVVIETRDDAGWMAADRINNLNQIMRNDINTVVTSPSSNTTVTWRYTWDLSGNMLTRTDGTNLTTYTWDEDNRLTQVQLPGAVTVSYTYDVLGRMLTRTDSGGTTHFVWDGMDCVQETDYLGDVTRYYIPNGMLMSFDRTVSGVTSTYQVHWDAISSIRKVTDSTGAVVATFDYDAWGNALASTSDSIPDGGLQYRFVGALGVRWDAGTGLYYMRARWYDPALGRFVSRDPVRATNRYRYAGNRPSSATDPSGKRIFVNTTSGPQIFATAQDFVNYMQTAGTQTVMGVTFSGHGNQYGQSVSRYTGANDISYDPSTGKVVVNLPDGNTIDLSQLLATSLAPGAKVSFDACSTAAGVDNLAWGLYKQLSQYVSDLQVSGATNVFGHYKDPVTGEESDRDVITPGGQYPPPDWKTYVDTVPMVTPNPSPAP